jgi:hypothetical protein
MSEQRKAGAVSDGGEKILIVFPKNSATEVAVKARLIIEKRGKGAKRLFFDIREQWFRDGPEQAPIPTRKGIMVPFLRTTDLFDAQLKFFLTYAGRYPDVMNRVAALCRNYLEQYEAVLANPPPVEFDTVTATDDGHDDASYDG